MTPTWVLSRPLLQRTDGPDSGRAWALGLTALYVVASLIYGWLSNAPWDDDCVVRYFHAREAWSKPDHFFSLWNRPLFMVLFAPTAWLGRTVMMVQMILISACSGWLLYRALNRSGVRDAHWVLPFFFFQTFYFSVSRNFLTEPLAVAVICIGLHALVHQRYLLFALMGGLLPLARLELSVILPIWGVVLLANKQWRALLVMAIPVVLLMILGYFVKNTDNLLWLVDETLGKDGKNRYGHRDVWHYFHRFAYVIGPIVFFFLITGVLERIARLRIDLFVVVQGAAILFLYVIFSWKLDMGNSAGFLRNLIPLAPFIALLAFDGLQAWQGVVAKNTGVPDAQAASDVGLNREERKRKKKAAPKVSHKGERSRSPWSGLIRVHLFGIVAVLILAVYFDKELLSHHKISAKVDHAPMIIAGLISALGMVLLAIFRTRPAPRWVLSGTGVLVTAGALGYTLYTERPDAHLNHERKAITEVSTLYRDSYLREWPLYCNHSWFFWPKEMSYPDRSRYRTLTKAALDTAEVHSVVLWENHYSHRLQGNVQLAEMYKRKDMVELLHVMGRDHRTTIGLFQKVDTTLKNDADALRERFNKAFPNNIYAVYADQLRHTRANDHAAALTAAQRMMELDSTYAEAVLARAQALSSMGRNDEAIAGFQRAMAMDTALFAVHYSIGVTQFRKKDYPAAIKSLTLYQQRDKKLKDAYDVLGASYFYQKEFDKAAAAFSEYIKLDPKAPNGWLNRASAYIQSNNMDLALADYDVILKRDPNNRTALLNKAVVLVRKNRKPEGCMILQRMAAAGDGAAAQQLAALCP
ncbi:MAG: tetratricopeptide repeat protein [Flavobacteriales bacterium]|nr:tetratricopeptide repeat protein [Flavobacteriales bacterium]